jgi:hypothetical protein
MLSNGKTVLSYRGQAAQLDGALPRPAYTWATPAPSDDASYGVDHVTIVNKINEDYAELRLRNPSLQEQPPTVPADALYPIDKSMYVLSAPLIAQYDQRLRAFVLEQIANSDTRYTLARDHRGGRALLAHLRTKAAAGLTSSEVRTILDEIDALVDAGLDTDTEAGFRAFLTKYNRLLQRIPLANGARDTPPTTAMRFIKVVVHNRPTVGQSVATHLRAGNIDQNDPTAVSAALLIFLADASSMARLMKHPPPPEPSLHALVAELKAALAVKPDPVTNERRDAYKPGTDKWRIAQSEAREQQQSSGGGDNGDTERCDKLALVTAKLQELAERADAAPTMLCAI